MEQAKGKPHNIIVKIVGQMGQTQLVIYRALEQISCGQLLNIVHLIYMQQMKGSKVIQHN